MFLEYNEEESYNEIYDDFKVSIVRNDDTLQISN